MHDQRRHQRIRFGVPPAVTIGCDGQIDHGQIENLSLSGIMVRSALPLAAGQRIGCEFSIFGSALIDVAAEVVSQVGNLFGARFQAGPISQVLIDDAIRGALATGGASILSVHTRGERKVLRLIGGLNASLRNDFMHALTRVGIDEIDAGGVTAVDSAGLSLCLVAVGRHHATLGDMSPCFATAWTSAHPGETLAAHDPHSAP